MHKANFSTEITKLATMYMVTERYKLGKNTIFRLADEAHAVVKIGRSVRYDVAKLDRLIEEKYTL